DRRLLQPRPEPPAPRPTDRPPGRPPVDRLVSCRHARHALHPATPTPARRADTDATAGRTRGARPSVGGALALLLDLRLLAAQRAQVVQLRAAHVTAGDDLDRVDGGRVQREGPLDADAEADLPHGEGLAHAAAGASDHDALERLDAGAVALDDLDVHLDGVAGTEVGDVVTQRSRIDGVRSEE